MEPPPGITIVRGVIGGSALPPPWAASAERLESALHDLDVAADVHQGEGIALVSVWVDLVVWTDGRWYRWWTGQTSAKTGRRLYHVYGTDNPVTVARAIVIRRTELQKAHPSAGPVLKSAS
jgi:hypothetical protein